MDRLIRIAHIGTFELKNYGDQLFPLVLQNELTKRLKNIKIDFFGPYGGKIDYDRFMHQVKGLVDISRLKMLSNYDVIIIGGGDLVRFDDHEVNGYYKIDAGARWSKNFKPATAMLIYKPWWWINKKPLLIWNGIGVIERSAWKCRKIASSINIITTRDHGSKKVLLKSGVKKEIKVIPDTALLIKDVLTDQGLSTNAKSFYEKHLIKIRTDKNKKLLGFHLGKWFIKDEIELRKIADMLINIRDKYNLEILLMPIGFCHGDFQLLTKINTLTNNSFLLPEKIISPIDIAFMISQCDFVISSSLHVNITASSFSIPHLAINTEKWRKISGFLEIINREKTCITDWSDLQKKVDLLLKECDYVSKNDVTKAKQMLSQYFDFVAEKILSVQNN